MLLFTFPAFAQAPIPAKKSEALGYEKSLKEEKQNQKALEKKAKDIQGQLKGTQSELVDLAADIQKNEKSLTALNIRIKDLEADKIFREDNLEKEKGRMAHLVLALERIRRRPPEALIVTPEAPLQTAQSVMLMKTILPGLQQSAENLKNDLKALEDVSRDLMAEKEDLAKISAELKERQKTLSGLLDTRKSLYARTQEDLAERQQKIKTISANAKNLQDLVQKLDQEKRQRAEKAKTQPVVLTAPSPKNVAPGSPRLPISGVITTAYDQPDNFGAPSKGVDIEGRGGALVVAPMGGIVKFTGPFKNYGQIVIIEHKGEYHSLVAGLEKIDTVVGQMLEAGEPIGTLHYSRTGQNPVLYYELRYNGKPINPARKFSGL